MKAITMKHSWFMSSQGEIKKLLSQIYKRKSLKIIMTAITISSSGIEKGGANQRGR